MQICGIEHPRGRYSNDSSVCFPMCTNTTVAVSTCVKIAYISAPCITHNVSQVWFNKMSFSSVTVAINNRKPLNKKSHPKNNYKRMSVFRKVNYKSVTQLVFKWQLRRLTLFSLLVIYNSLMHANKAKPQTVFLSHMMDDLRREFHNLLLFETLPWTDTQKHSFNSSISCARAWRWDRDVHTDRYKFIGL